jgi:hypothetical protein
MFGLFDAFKYRTEVTVQIHAILKLVPQLGSLLRTFPSLRQSINEFRKTKIPEIEAAAWMSLLVIERIMVSVPQEIRLLTLRYLDEKSEDMFRWFAKYGKAVISNEIPEHPKGMPNLTSILGFAFWYFGVAVRENRLSEECYQIFVGDVIGMLRGRSQDERKANRLHHAIHRGRQ